MITTLANLKRNQYYLKLPRNGPAKQNLETQNINNMNLRFFFFFEGKKKHLGIPKTSPIFQHPTKIITSSTWLIAKAAMVYIRLHASERCCYLLRCHLNKRIPLQLSAALSSVESDPLSTVSSELSSGRTCTLLAFFTIQLVNSDEDANSVIACLVES